MVKKGEHVNVQHGEHDNALYVAPVRSNEMLVQLLVKKNADVCTSFNETVWLRNTI